MFKRGKQKMNKACGNSCIHTHITWHTWFTVWTSQRKGEEKHKRGETQHDTHPNNIHKCPCNGLTLTRKKIGKSLCTKERERARSQEREILVLLPLSLFPPSPQVVVTYFLSYFFLKSSQVSQVKKHLVRQHFFCPWIWVVVEGHVRKWKSYLLGPLRISHYSAFYLTLFLSLV